MTATATHTTSALYTAHSGILRGEPTSTTLVLYALAAVLDNDTQDRSVWTHDVARAAGLAESTTRGHLLRLQAKHVVREMRGLWSLV